MRLGPTCIFVLQACLLVAVVMTWVSTRYGSKTSVAFVRSDLPPWSDPVVNGPKIHDLVFPGVARTVVKVNAHPHNNDPNFDFWGAVGSFNADEPPRSSGWEIDSYIAMEKLLFPGQSVFIGVGGWIGARPLYAATRAAQVWLFEPDQPAFVELRANFALNPDLDAKSHLSTLCIDPGLSEQGLYGIADSESRLEYVNNGWKHSSGKPYVDLPLQHVHCMDFSRAVTVFRMDPDPTKSMFIFIDTEGSEFQLLPSLEAFIAGRSRKPSLSVSIHGQAPTQLIHDTFVRVLKQYPHVYLDAVRANREVDLSTFTTLCAKVCTYYAVSAEDAAQAGL